MIEILLTAVLVAAFMAAFEPAHRRILRGGPQTYGADRARVLAEWHAAARHLER